jgi:UDPglucose 6-dehydrogenase
MQELYAPFVRTGKPIVLMDVKSAELTNYACNAMLATRISFMNEMASLCEKLGANIGDVRKGMGLDSRIGQSFLFSGIGYGGSCFPKDVKALVKTAEKVGHDLKVLKAVEAVNERQKEWVLRRVDGHYTDGVKGRTFAVWGLSFKPNTDDMREAPAIVVIEGLLSRGAKVKVTDPVAMQEARHHFGDRVTYCAKNYETLAGADALVVCTEWNEFRHPDFERIRSTLRDPVVFDGRNIYRAEQLRKLGFTYYGVGIP